MTTGTSTDASGDNRPTISNRLFLSNIDYKNYDFENDTGDGDFSTEEVRQWLNDLFAKYGSVLEIYLSNKEDANMLKDEEQEHPPFGFVEMETAEEAQAALTALRSQQQTEAVDPKFRRLFQEVALAKVQKPEKNKPNKNERLRSERLAEYRKRLASISGTNVVCQVHSSHLDRLQGYVVARNDVSLVSSFSAQKGTSLLFLRVDDSEKCPSDDNNNGDDYLERFSRVLWDTWFVAPNLNRITVLNNSKVLDNDHCDDDRHCVQGNIRTGVVPAIYRSLSEIKNKDNKAVESTVFLRVAIFPPKLQKSLLEGLEEYNQKRKHDETDCCGNMDIQFSPGNPTHTISIIQVHPGVVVTPKSKGDNDKALYIIGRLEVVPKTRKRSLSNDSSSSRDNKYRFQQQRTSRVPQLLTSTIVNDNDNTVASKSNLEVIDSTTKLEDSNTSENEDDKSISRAFWKLQEAWERYNYEPPSLSGTIQNNREPMWALDCGAAPRRIENTCEMIFDGRYHRS